MIVGAIRLLLVCRRCVVMQDVCPCSPCVPAAAGREAGATSSPAQASLLALFLLSKLMFSMHCNCQVTSAPHLTLP